MKKTEHLTKGIVILESLKLDGTIPDYFKYEEKRYSYLLDKKYPCTILVLKFPIDNLNQILFDVSERLHEKKYYAHFIYDDRIYIVFPKCITFAERMSTHLFDRCRRIGYIFDIPYHQMQFEELFDVDHPD